MDNLIMNFAKWLQNKLDERQINPTALANAINENQPTIQRILSGETKNPRLKIIKKLESFFKDEFIELPPNSYKVDVRKIAYPPVYGKGMGGLPNNLFTDEDRLSNGHDEYGEVYSGDKNAFITRVEGNSMYPAYFDGGYALVEPDTKPEIEDVVLIKLNTGQVMLKKLISYRGGVVLGSYNEPQLHTFSNDQIVWMYYVAYPVPSRKIKHRV